MAKPLPPVAEVAVVIETLLAASVEAADDDSAILRVGDTVCQRATGGRPRNKVIGFGESDAARIDEILAFYDETGLEPTFYLSPARFGPRTAAALARSGFGQVEFEQAHMFGRPTPDTGPASDEIVIEAVTPQTVAAFVETTAEGFEWSPEWRRAAVESLRGRMAVDGITHFLATYHGQPAGVGDLRVRDGLATLGGGAVRPEFRRRGVHTALLRHRIALAGQAGVDLVLTGASYGSSSHRNQQRVGLQLAYVESAWRRSALHAR